MPSVQAEVEEGRAALAGEAGGVFVGEAALFPRLCVAQNASAFAASIVMPYFLHVQVSAARFMVHPPCPPPRMLLIDDCSSKL